MWFGYIDFFFTKAIIKPKIKQNNVKHCYTCMNANSTTLLEPLFVAYEYQGVKLN